MNIYNEGQVTEVNNISKLRGAQIKEEEQRLGIEKRTDIPAYFPNGEQVEFKESQLLIQYPEQILKVLGSLYTEYSRVFSNIANSRRESESDYQYAQGNLFVQIDMVGLPSEFLEKVEEGAFTDTELSLVLRQSIFEIENSLAAYSLLRNLGNPDENLFAKNLDQSLQTLRDTTGMKIALATCTDEKFSGVSSFDAGLLPKRPQCSKEILKNTGFDDIYDPGRLSSIKESDNTIYYVRASLDRIGLVKPQGNFNQNILGDPELRRYLRSRSLTYNIDTPGAPYKDILNDTKEYMPDMEMGFLVEDISNILFQDYRDFLSRNNSRETYLGNIYTPELQEYLYKQGYSTEEIASGGIEFQLKPLKGVYGGYGQISGTMMEGSKRSKLKKEINNRGSYILQARMPRSSVINVDTGERFIYIDRIFMTKNPGNDEVTFMGGFRNYMPSASTDGKKGIVHGSSQTVYGIINKK